MFGNLLNTFGQGTGQLVRNVGLVGSQLFNGGKPIHLGANNTSFGQNMSNYFKPTQSYAAAPSSQLNGDTSTGLTGLNGAAIDPNIFAQTGGGTPTTTTTGGGGGYGGTLQLQSPDFSNPGPSAQDSIGLLNQQYDQAANDISAQNPYLDQSYNLAKGDIGTAIDSATGKADAQKTANEKTYGDVLKQAVQTYNELKQREQGTFSALGTLDSSAYQDAALKADQGVADQTNSINTQKAGSNNQIDSQLNDYTNQAHSQLAQLGIQYQQGKDAIASALAHNRLDQASAIQSALQQIRSNAQSIANNIINFQNQAQLLKAQGLNVQTNIGNVSAAPFANTTNQFLAGVANQGAQTYQVPTQTGPQYLGAQQKNKIDPVTGLPVSA